MGLHWNLEVKTPLITSPGDTMSEPDKTKSSGLYKPIRGGIANKESVKNVID
jgi:hypothetical protein